MKALWRALPFVLIACLSMLLVFYPSPQSSTAAAEIVEVWNVDTFEGGKGSRTSFLAGVARRLEKKREGVYYYVTDYTLQGARAAWEKGKYPDMLSYGVGLSDLAERCLPLPYRFYGGSLGGKCLAVPWCRGQYALFSLTEDFSAEGKTAVSEGGQNIAACAAALGGVEGECLPSAEAYTGFLSGEYRYLLGTQRDICRFAARGVQVFRRDLPAYCDLYQTVSVLNGDKWENCLALVEELLSGDTQDALERIGMYPPKSAEGECTVSIFASPEALEQLRREAGSRPQKNLTEFLKTI